MRKIDKSKPIIGKAAKTINFEKIVLLNLEEKAYKEGTTVSNLVNLFCRKIILNDVNYLQTMSKFHYLKFQEYQFMKEQAVIMKEV